MAKNTNSSAFRKIDVDAYNEDNFRDEDASNSTGVSSIPDSAQFGALLAQGKGVEVLKAVLSQPPLGSKNQQEKDAAAQVVMKVLLTIKNASQVESVVNELDNDQRDVLMKYIYRGFENPSEGSSALLLLWHEKVFEVAGVGSIVRVLTDRKRV